MDIQPGQNEAAESRGTIARRLRLLASASLLSLASLGLPLSSSSALAAPQTPAKTADIPSGFPKEPQAPAGAPNVLLIMTDDVGFAASATFGGPVPTPTYSKLASHSIRYNEFHTTAMCSPTRAALLTGRNHHMVNYGSIAEVADGVRGYNSVIPNSAATIGKVLQMNGYDTSWLGKDHNVPVWENTPLGPYNHWPNAMGFGYFYGFFGGATNQFAPELIENRNAVEPPTNDPHYILDHDLATHAIHWLEMQHSLHPEKPFFMYYAPGSTHAPHQAPAKWIAKFKGKFSEGWDKMREETFKRQKRMGIIPKDAVLTPRPPQIPSWKSMSPEEKKVATRMMQVYAGMLAYSDNQIGRVIAYLKKSGEFKHTLIIFIQGDNGASPEGANHGDLNDLAGLNGHRASVQYMFKHMDELGGPRSFGNYPTGWAWAMDTPFQWTKEIASHLGGTRNDLVISWPGHMKDIRDIRSQFHHVIDIAPTIYQAAHIKPPKTVDGVKQMPLQGVSMLYTFDHPNAPSTHHEQYFEMLGNRAFYKNGWMASTKPEDFAWLHSKHFVPPKDFPWELYDLKKDYSQGIDVAKKFPKKLAELRHDFYVAAKKNHVYPLQANFFSRVANKNRPYITNGRTDFTYHNGPYRYSDAAFPDVLNKSWTVTADIDVPAQNRDGMIVTQGGWFGGWGLMVRNGKPEFVYKTTEQVANSVDVIGSEPLSPGHHVLKADFDYEGGGLGKGAKITLQVDGHAVAQGRLKHSLAFIVGEDAAIGRDTGTALTDAYKVPFKYLGRINSVKIHLARAE